MILVADFDDDLLANIGGLNGVRAGCRSRFNDGSIAQPFVVGVITRGGITIWITGDRRCGQF